MNRNAKDKTAQNQTQTDQTGHIADQTQIFLLDRRRGKQVCVRPRTKGEANESIRSERTEREKANRHRFIRFAEEILGSCHEHERRTIDARKFSLHLHLSVCRPGTSQEWERYRWVLVNMLIINKQIITLSLIFSEGWFLFNMSTSTYFVSWKTMKRIPNPSVKATNFIWKTINTSLWEFSVSHLVSPCSPSLFFFSSRSAAPTDNSFRTFIRRWITTSTCPVSRRRRRTTVWSTNSVNAVVSNGKDRKRVEPRWFVSNVRNIILNACRRKPWPMRLVRRLKSFRTAANVTEANSAIRSLVPLARRVLFREKMFMANVEQRVHSAGFAPNNVYLNGRHAVVKVMSG